MISRTALLTENDVIQSVTKTLTENAWKVDSFCTTSQVGIDIRASRNGVDFFIEAKGVTSSKEGSSRYGKVQSRISRIEPAMSRREAFLENSVPYDTNHGYHRLCW